MNLCASGQVVNVLAGITLPNEASQTLHESFGFKVAGTFKDVGFKKGKWWDVGWWQMQLQKPEKPQSLLKP
jgi:phosphinothricin acetyltransferase